MQHIGTARRALAALGAAALTLSLAGPSAAAPGAGDGSAWRSPVRPSPATIAALESAARNAAVGKVGAAAHPQVVVRGLNNPRQLDRGPGGGLYIAEAGRGGDTCFGEGEEEFCLGETGAVSFVGRPGQATDTEPRRINTGHLSAAGPDGTFALGATGVAKFGAKSGRFHSVFNFAPPDLVPEPLPGEQLGKLIRATWANRKHIVADIAAYEFENNPDGEGVDSNPYAVLDLGGRLLVADAAADTVYSVSKETGDINVFAVIDTSSEGRDPVPTSLARGPHRSILVGTLGAGEAPGAAEVRAYSRKGKLLHTVGGFTTVVGVAYDKRHDDLYVSELFAGEDPEAIPGALTKVAADGERQTVPVPVPGGVAVNKKGIVFVAAWSIGTEDGTFGIPDSSGQVWRMRF